MNGYQVDWVGALSAGVAAVISFFLAKILFPRQVGMRFYLVVGVVAGVLSFVFRELLRQVGI
jgi:hypothetical protein